MKICTLLTLLIALSACARAPVDELKTSGASAEGKTYQASTALLANPERGFYHYSGDCDKDTFQVAELVAYRTHEKVSLVMCMFYLSEFKASAISQAKLEHFNKQAATIRKAGLKMVLRFAYTDSPSKPDAPLSRVKAHLVQLAPHLKANSDVIAVVQAGFVGAWGEGYYTRYFGDRGVVSQTNWADRKAIITELLKILPSTMSVQVRTPKMKTQMFGVAPVSSGTAFGSSPISRVGHHNDSFLSDATDQGTYEDVDIEYSYLRQDTTYTPVGGETHVLNPPRSSCPTAQKELGLFHYTYLNRDFAPEVLRSWSAGGCLSQIERKLGYRFRLIKSEFPTSVQRGARFTGRLVFHNDGWAGTITPRPIELVLRETTTRKVTRLKVSTDPRRWSAGADKVISQVFVLPATLTTGTYELLLDLPDASVSLKSRPEYALQLANNGLWEVSTGLNRLLRTIDVY